MGDWGMRRTISSGTISSGLSLALATTLVLMAGALTSDAEAQFVDPGVLGTAGSFGVLAGTGVTNTGPTVIHGNVGSAPTDSFTGFGTVTIINGTRTSTAVAQTAQDDLTAAYTTLM